jgi:hypothetical protein
MNAEITPEHFVREAVVYIRQSTHGQVIENTERFGFLCNGICAWLQTSSAPDREAIALSAWEVVQYAYV